MVSIIEELESKVLENAQGIEKLLKISETLNETVTNAVVTLVNYRKLLLGYSLITIGISLFIFGLTFVILQRLGIIQIFKRKGKLNLEIKRSEALVQAVEVVPVIQALPEKPIVQEKIPQKIEERPQTEPEKPVEPKIEITEEKKQVEVEKTLVSVPEPAKELVQPPPKKRGLFGGLKQKKKEVEVK